MGLFNSNQVNENDTLGFEDALDERVGFIRLGRTLRVNIKNMYKYEHAGGDKIWLYFDDGGKRVKYLVKGSVDELDALLDCKVSYNISQEVELD